jgi:hypothetical protein
LTHKAADDPKGSAREETKMAERKKGWFLFVVMALSGLLFCCSNEQAEKPGVLAVINNYELTLDDFETQLADELELDRDFKLTQEAKQTFLEGLIKKQLLIQEAKKMKLDAEEDFVRAIQRHWESTLIKNLIESKSAEISKKIYVSEEEIQARYEQMSKSAPVPPLSELQDVIQEEIKENKKTGKLKDWIDDLRQHADVHINDALL